MEEMQILKQYYELKRAYTDVEDMIILMDLYFQITNKSPKSFVISKDFIMGIKERLNSVDKNINKTFCLDKYKTYENLLKDSITVIETSGPLSIAIIMNDGSIVYLNLRKKQPIYATCIITDNLNSAERIKNMLVWEPNKEKDTYFYLVDNGKRLSEVPLQFNELHVDLGKNYNDDIPYNQMIGFLKNNNPGIIILHGEPGTGKTSFIRHMIGEIPAKKFVIIQPETLLNAAQAKLLDYFMENATDTVFILEDCEKLLMRREKGTDLHTLLNMSDGLLGNTFNVKFICTFNTDINNIDKAILRKGRLKVRYEFRKLSLEKTRLHLPEAEKEMTLGEIYNQEENEFGTKEKKRIGF